MIRVGITGGIGSGKSTICQIWEQEGAYIINADQLAKEIMVSDPMVIRAITETFGENAYYDDGSLNRHYLAKLAFAENRVGELNALVHPAVYKESDRRMLQAERDGYPMAVREAAILLQNGRPTDLDAIVLVLADRNSRIDRVSQRDGTSTSQVTNRMNAQPDYEAYIPLADVIIRNDGNIESLWRAAKDVFWKLV